jgi:tetratricopeptide (TPR) repeat protein
MAIARRLGSRDYHCITAGILMARMTDTGNWGAIEAVAAEPFQVSDTDGPAADVHFGMAVIWSLRGDLERARRHLAGVASWRTGDDIELRAGYHAATAAVALASGELEEALQEARAAVEAESAFAGAKIATRRAWPDAVDAAVGLGRLDALDELIEELERRAPGHVAPYLRGELRRAKGLAAAARGERDVAEAELETAIAIHESLGYPFATARAQTALAALRVHEGRDEDAETLLESVRATFERLGAVPPVALVDRLPARAPDDAPLARL